MHAGFHSGLRRYLRQALSTLATVSLSVIVTVFVMRGLAPQQVHAQQGQAGVVQASEFDVVGSNGAVLARLQPGKQGNGQLILYDTAGTQRVVLAGAGVFDVSDPDGVTRFVAGYTVTPNPQGRPPFSGVLLDPSGTIGVLPTSP